MSAQRSLQTTKSVEAMFFEPLIRKVRLRYYGHRENKFYMSTSTLDLLNTEDRENFFYEGWLLRPVPFDYFSTGEMVTNFLGEFVLDWNSSTSSWQAGPSTNYWAYTRVIITLEAKDGNPDPDRHILEGEFGN